MRDRKASPVVLAPFSGFLRLFVGYARWRALSASGLIALGAALEGVGLLLLAPLLHLALDDGNPGDVLPDWLGGLARLVEGSGREQRLAVLLAAFAAVIILRAAIMIARDGALARLQYGFVDRLRADLVGRMDAASWTSHAGIERARIVQALGGEAQQIGAAAQYTLLCGVALAMLAANGAVAVAIAPMPALWAAALLIAAVLGVLPLIRRVQRLSGRILSANRTMTAEAMHLLDTLKVSTAQDARTAVSALYRRTSSSASAELVRFLRLQSIGRNLILTFCGLGAILVSAAGAASGYLSSAQIIVLIFALARLASPLLLLQQSAQIILNTLPAYGALLDLNQSLGASISSQAPGPPASTPPHCGAIAMRRAGLAYGAVRGLEGVTVTIEPGAVIGVTGPSGSGKTSFLDLVAGLIEPRQGTVEVGGLPLAGDALSRHRAGLSYATAEPVIWSGSLRRNLEWAAAGIDDAAIWTALEEVGLAARLRLAGHTLDSHWEAPDRQLSMGERQRIILARILLHRPSLIILDEATNSIDAASERQILGAFRDRFSDSTLILVTHRKESLTICDRVLAFDRGRLVEDRRVRAPNQRFVPLRAGQWTQACL